MTLLLDIAQLLPRIPDADLAKFCAWYEKYAPHFDTIDARLYRRLPEGERERFLTWFLKRWAKIDLVNPVERSLYLATVQRLKDEPREAQTLEGRPYRLRNFASQGYDFNLLGYDWVLGVHDIEYNQYEHADVALRPGDVIIDAGAFIGDTAVFFHHKLGGACEVHSFELLDDNLRLLVHNLEMNGVRGDQVVLNKLALADRTGDFITINRGGTEGAASIFGRDAGGDRVETISLDDYVAATKPKSVDFIKMDIEGAEPAALHGARHTIRHFTPRLAICLYHKWDDVLTIPAAIDATGVDYRFAFKWVQLIDGWEAVLHAVPAHEATAKSGPAPQAISAADAAAARAARLTLDTFTKAYMRRCAQIDSMSRAVREAANAPREVAVA